MAKKKVTFKQRLDNTVRAREKIDPTLHKYWTLATHALSNVLDSTTSRIPVVGRGVDIATDIADIPFAVIGDILFNNRFTRLATSAWGALPAHMIAKITDANLAAYKFYGRVAMNTPVVKAVKSIPKTIKKAFDGKTAVDPRPDKPYIPKGMEPIKDPTKKERN